MSNQSKLPTQVLKGFKRLINEYGFIPVSKRTEFVTLLKKVTNEIFLYIFVKGEKKDSSLLDVHVWIVPPSYPDDRFDKFYVGFKIWIGSTWEIDPTNFFNNIEIRIINILPVLENFAEAVVYELNYSVFKTKAFQIYLLEREAFFLAKKCAEEGNKTAIRVVEKYKDYPIDDLDYYWENESNELATEMIASELLTQEMQEFYGDKPEFLSSALKVQFYLDRLGKLSEQICSGDKTHTSIVIPIENQTTLDQEVLLITQIIECDACYSLGLLGILTVSGLEEGLFSVSYDDGKKEVWSETFSFPEDAAQFFVLQRKKRKLGFDFKQVVGTQMITVISTSKNQTTSDQEISLITQILEYKIGYCVELYDILTISGREDGSFNVSYDDGKEEIWEKTFNVSKEAAQFFVLQRMKHKIGFDFEHEEWFKESE